MTSALSISIYSNENVLTSPVRHLGVRVVYFSWQSQVAYGFLISSVREAHMSVSSAGLDEIHFIDQGIVLGLGYIPFGMSTPLSREVLEADLRLRQNNRS